MDSSNPPPELIELDPKLRPDFAWGAGLGFLQQWAELRGDVEAIKTMLALVMRHVGVTAEEIRERMPGEPKPPGWWTRGASRGATVARHATRRDEG